MKSYKNKPQIAAGIFFCLIGCFLFPIKSSNTFFYYLKYGLGLCFEFAGLIQFLGDLMEIEFQEDRILILRMNKSTRFINKVDILDVTVANKKIYIQTKYENYTVKKHFFWSDDFDAIINAFLKIKAENRTSN